MTEDPLLEFLIHPEPERFDALIEARLRSGKGTTAPDHRLGKGGPGAPSAGPGLDAVPAPVLDASTSPTQDDRLLDALAAAHWDQLDRPSGTPLLLLVESGGVSGERRGRSPESRFADAIVRTTAEDELVRAVAQGRTDRLSVRSWLAGRQRAGRPAWIVATDSEARKLLDDLDRRRLLFRLPPGSRCVRLGAHDALCAPGAGPDAIVERLGVPFREQSALLVQPTLASFIPAAAAGPESYDLGPAPPWMRYEIVRGDDPSVERQRLGVLDLATTELPFFQILDWPIATDDGGIRIQVAP